MKTAVLLILCFLAAAAFPVRADWTPLEKGLSYRKMTTAARGRQVTLHALKVEPRPLRLRPVFADGTVTARKLADRDGALALVNANFFDTAIKPLGLVIVDKEVKNPLRDISWWAVFCLKRNRPAIIHTRDYRAGVCQEAVQAGPRLVVNGSVPKLKDENSRKTALGITPKGDVVLVVSEQRIPIKDLAELFRKPESEGGLGCPDAMNLDGGSSSQLYVKAQGLTLSVPSYVNFPVGLGVFRK